MSFASFINWKPIKSHDFLIIHCSATPPSMDIGAVEIRRWHEQRGWFDIGYHYVIRRNGIIEKGRPENRPGAHVRGANEISLGICLVGGVREGTKDDAEDNFTPQQWASLRDLIVELKSRYPKAGVIGHRDVPGVAKECPCFDVLSWYERTFGDDQRGK